MEKAKQGRTTAADRKRGAQQRQAAAKKAAGNRIRSGQQRQASVKKSVRARRAKRS